MIDASNQSSTSQDVHSTPSFPQSSLGSLPAPLLPMPQSGSATATTDTVVVSTSASEAPQSVCMPFDGSGHDIALEALRQRRLELKQQHEQTLLVKSNNSTPVVNEAQTEIFSASTINVSPSSRSQPHHQPQNVPVLSDINYAELESKLQSLEPLHGLQQASFRDDTSGAKHSATSEQHYDLMLGNTLPSSESKVNSDHAYYMHVCNESVVLYYYSPKVCLCAPRYINYFEKARVLLFCDCLAKVFSITVSHGIN